MMTLKKINKNSPKIIINIKELGPNVVLENSQIPTKCFQSVNYSDIYRKNISSLCPSVYTDRKILSVHTKEIRVGNKGMKKKNMTCHYYKWYYQ